MDPLNKDDGSQPEALKSTGGAVDSIFKCEQTCTASASYNNTTKGSSTKINKKTRGKPRKNRGKMKKTQAKKRLSASRFTNSQQNTAPTSGTLKENKSSETPKARAQHHTQKD